MTAYNPFNRTRRKKIGTGLAVASVNSVIVFVIGLQISQLDFPRQRLLDIVFAFCIRSWIKEGASKSAAPAVESVEFMDRHSETFRSAATGRMRERHFAGTGGSIGNGDTFARGIREGKRVGYTQDRAWDHDGEAAESIGNDGELAGIRTQDPRLKRALLYQLSYELVQCRSFKTNTVKDGAGVGADPAGGGACCVFVRSSLVVELNQ